MTPDHLQFRNDPGVAGPGPPAGDVVLVHATVYALSATSISELTPITSQRFVVVVVAFPAYE